MLQTKSVKADIEIDEKARRVVGYASTFGNVDHDGDIVVKGAFAKTIKERGPAGNGLIKAFWNHWSPFGMPEEMKEDETGLLTVTKVADLTENTERMRLIEAGIAGHMSIGYDVIKSDSDEVDGEEVKLLKELRLHEYSPVIWPANEQAQIIEAKMASLEAGDIKKILREILEPELRELIKELARHAPREAEKRNQEPDEVHSAVTALCAELRNAL